VLDLGRLEDHPTSSLPGFTEHLLEMLPGLQQHSCSRGRRGGFVERLNEGTWLGHVAEHCALALQQVVGHDIRRGKTRQVKGRKGVYNVIYGYADEQVGLAAGRLAVRLVNHLVQADPEFDWDAELESFILRAERTAFGPSTQAILDEAVSRDIPWIRLNQYSLVQLGQGVHAKRIRATMTSATSAIAVDVASDKDLTTRLLGAAGLPVPKQQSVRSGDGAVTAANRIGFPVVVKPLDGNHGRGVCLDLKSEDDVREAFPIAEEQSRRGNVIVESFVTGKDYRCLIIDGRMIAIAERVPAHVVGDGRSTVEQLVELTNADPRRGVGHEKVLTRIKVDAGAKEVLAGQGHSLDSVPENGEMVKLALTGNMSTGGISIDRTFEAHPENVEIAEEAARMIGLDIAGIDFICPDITEPVRETGGAICEVNAAPGFRMHTHPTIGEPQFISKPVVDMLFPPGAPSRIPIVAVTGTNGKTTTAELLGAIHRAAELPVVVAGNVGTPLASLVGSIDAGTHVVCEVSSFQAEDSEALRPECALLLNITEDHLDRHGSFDAYREAKLRLFANQGKQDVAVVRPGTEVPGEAAAVTFGGRYADLSLRDGMLSWRGDALMAAQEIRLRGEHNLENAMGAAAAALALGLPVSAVKAALGEFTGVPHRLEEVGMVGAVLYVNDSKATNVSSAVRGIEAFDGGVHVILGGSLKGGGFEGLREAVASRCVAAYLIGEAAERLEVDLEGTVPLQRSGDLESAVGAAAAAAQPADVVLLSPACASFDQFRDYEERGDSFRALVPRA
jgi:UDP-N-acetylmuramoylalanine--D-glutamate ligase